MPAMFEIPIETETLTRDELIQITGCVRKADQLEWLKTAYWNFVINKAGEPVVGRLYARLKLAGINPEAFTTLPAWTPDFSKMK